MYILMNLGFIFLTLFEYMAVLVTPLDLLHQRRKRKSSIKDKDAFIIEMPIRYSMQKKKTQKRMQKKKKKDTEMKTHFVDQKARVVFPILYIGAITIYFICCYFYRREDLKYWLMRIYEIYYINYINIINIKLFGTHLYTLPIIISNRLYFLNDL